MTIKIELLSGPPGGGKSHAMLEEAITKPGRYVFCSPTTALIDEQIKVVRDAGVEVYRCDYKSNARTSVERQLADRQSDLKQRGVSHVVIFITHATMLATPASAFQGWHMRIDEAPDGLKTGRLALRTDHSRKALAEFFDLDAVGEWAVAKPKLRSPGWKAAAADHLLGTNAEFFRLAERPYGLFVRTRDWSESDVDWLSLWSPSRFAQAASVRVAAASYEKSLAYRAAKSWFGLQLTKRTINRSKAASQACVTVHYFTEGHEGSSFFWATSRGRWMIKAVCDHLAALPSPVGFWSGNGEVQKLMEWRVGGEDSLTKPKLAGQNQYDDRTSCALIYSSKPLPGDAILKDLFSLSDGDILAAREDEDIHQFVMRGALRDPTFSGHYSVYLYSKRQAETLAKTLTRNGYCVVVYGVAEAGIIQEGRAERREPSPKVEMAIRVPNARGTGDRLRKSAQRQEQRQAKKLRDASQGPPASNASAT